MTTLDTDMYTFAVRGGHSFTVVDAPETASWHFWEDWFAPGHWEPDLLAHVDDILGDYGLLVDVGAWVGPVTLWAARVPTRMVIAIEPDPVAYSQLAKNIDANGFQNVVAIEAAATNHFGETRLYRRGSGYGNSESSIMGREEDEHLVVGAIDLVTMLKVTPQIRLVKVDVEGGEVAIFPRLSMFCRERDIPILLSLHVPPDQLGSEWSRWTITPLAKDAHESFLLIPL